MSWWKKNDKHSPSKHHADASDARKSSTHSQASSSRSFSLKSNSKNDSSYKQADFGELRSALGEGTVIQGKLSFDTPVRIDGNLSGELFSSSLVVVGKSGRVTADINVDTLVVFGTVCGDIIARKRLELNESGEIVGSITCPSLLIASGSYFEGECSMEISATDLNPTQLDPLENVSDQKDKGSSSSQSSATRKSSKAGKEEIVSDPSKTAIH